MIKIKTDFIKIDTENTTLLLSKRATGVEKLYYGKKLKDGSDYSVFSCKDDFHASVDDDDYFSSVFSSGDGNDREKYVSVCDENGAKTDRFSLEQTEIVEVKSPDELPCARGRSQTLALRYFNEEKTLRLTQYFTLFDGYDVISCFSELENFGSSPCFIERLMSWQMDFYGDGETTVLCGAWGAERKPVTEKVGIGVRSFSSGKGFSSNRYNPFLLFKNEDGCYASNLVWSGEHKESVEKTPLGQIRLLSGLNDKNLRYKLGSGERFVSPECLFTYAKTEEEISHIFHAFINKNILPERFVGKERPIVLNSWEAMYFDFDRARLLALAEKAMQIGVETFVLDDGWFGSRNDARGSLGDWYDNVAKTGGVRTLRDAVCRKGLQFGIWVEPEMISVDSELYRAHPEYAMTIPEVTPVEKRDQLILDLVNPDVSAYIVERISALIEEIQPHYIKWDCNRDIFDAYAKKKDWQGGYFYDYIKSLYGIFKTLTEKYPDVLIEACSAGGNRFDLGILCYMPQIWCSDNTDASDRSEIQRGTLRAYPQSVISAHVSASTNHQSGRTSAWEDRFAVALTGAFGYELDLLKCNDKELATIKKQIAFYKKYRGVISFGDCYCNGGEENAGYTYVSKDKKTAIAVLYTRKDAVNRIHTKFRLNGLDENAFYRVQVITQEKEFSFSCYGDVLNSSGLDFGDVHRNGFAFSTALVVILKED